MRERIILAPGLNGSEFIRMLALHGVNCMNLKIMNAVELARLSLLRAGVSVKERQISSREEVIYITKAMKGEPYFQNASYSDVLHLTKTIRRVRTFVSEADELGRIRDILSQGIFQKKNQALLHVLERYVEILKEESLADAVELIRRAILQKEGIDAEFITLKEYSLTALEEALLQQVSGGKVQSLNLMELSEKKNPGLQIKECRCCYGAPNEAEMILSEIYARNRLDQCTVALTNQSVYSQVFFDEAMQHEIPITFGCGIPIGNSNPAQLLKRYVHWIGDGFFGADALQSMLRSPAFDRKKFRETVMGTETALSFEEVWNLFTDLRFSNDARQNQNRLEIYEATATPEEVCYLPTLRMIARELALPMEEFLSRYAFLRKGNGTFKDDLLMKLDYAALRNITEELAVSREEEQPLLEVIDSILKQSVLRQSNQPGALYVTGISDAVTAVREHLFVAGLSASNYPGIPTEDYLLLDADLELFGESGKEYTSYRRVERKREALQTLLHLACAYESEIYLSYSGTDVAELKKDNASSQIFEIFREQAQEEITSRELEEQILKTGYFDPSLSVTKEIGTAYIKGKRICTEEREKDKATASGNLERAYSPSALHTFFSCPRSFMLEYLLGIRKREEEDIFEVISAAELGTLAHTLMEDLADLGLSKESFLQRAEEAFDAFLCKNPPLVPERAIREKEDFLGIMENAYVLDPHREVVLKEEDMYCIHESGVRLHGFPDRVEKREDGTFWIVDFKTGRRISHEQDDVDSCLQIVIYAYLMEQKGYKICGGEFRYLRLGKTVTCRYDREMKEKLNEKLLYFRECMEKGSFPCAEAEEGKEAPCKYCTYGNICQREQNGGMM